MNPISENLCCLSIHNNHEDSSFNSDHPIYRFKIIIFPENKVWNVLKIEVGFTIRIGPRNLFEITCFQFFRDSTWQEQFLIPRYRP